jgi:hypothetical protein
MSSDLRITLSGEAVGHVRLIQPKPGLSAVRTAHGFRVQIPGRITFSPPSNSGLPLSLENLRLTMYWSDAANQVEIGVAHCDSIFTTPMRDAPIQFSWDWTLSAFGHYEQLRAGREPKFRLLVCGDIRYLFVPADGKRNGREPCSVAKRFHEWGEVSYSQRVWTSFMRDLNLRDSILVEIPLPSDPPTGWEPVWSALRNARDSFDNGGATGWKNAAISVRLALEEWQRLEKEDQGPGWQRPDRADLESRTKLQRIDNIRWHLIQLAHHAAHTKAEEWSRDDALL